MLAKTPERITEEWLDKHFTRHPKDFKITPWESWVDITGRVIWQKVSNRVGTEFTVHVDNRDFKSIGHADLAYVHEFEWFMAAIGAEDLIPYV